MNREVKYRAYIKNDYNKELIGKILEVSSIHLKTKKAIIGYSLSKSNYGNKSFSFDDIELMQYTGLHDKNGKEIYEGDVVTNGDKNIKYIVEWYDTGLRARQYNNKSYIGLEYWKDVLEVIGNMYDNPELLGEE